MPEVVGKHDLLSWAVINSGLSRSIDDKNLLEDGEIFCCLLFNLFPSLQNFQLKKNTSLWKTLVYYLEHLKIPRTVIDANKLKSGQTVEIFSFLALMYFLSELSDDEEFVIDFSFSLPESVMNFLQSEASIDTLIAGGKVADDESSSSFDNSSPLRVRLDTEFSHSQKSRKTQNVESQSPISQKRIPLKMTNKSSFKDITAPDFVTQMAKSTSLSPPMVAMSPSAHNLHQHQNLAADYSKKQLNSSLSKQSGVAPLTSTTKNKIALSNQFSVLNQSTKSSNSVRLSPSASRKEITTKKVVLNKSPNKKQGGSIKSRLTPVSNTQHTNNNFNNSNTIQLSKSFDLLVAEDSPRSETSPKKRQFNSINKEVSSTVMSASSKFQPLEQNTSITRPINNNFNTNMSSTNNKTEAFVNNLKTLTAHSSDKVENHLINCIDQQSENIESYSLLPAHNDELGCDHHIETNMGCELNFSHAENNFGKNVDSIVKDKVNSVSNNVQILEAKQEELLELRRILENERSRTSQAEQEAIMFRMQLQTANQLNEELRASVSELKVDLKNATRSFGDIWGSEMVRLSEFKNETELFKIRVESAKQAVSLRNEHQLALKQLEGEVQMDILALTDANCHSDKAIEASARVSDALIRFNTDALQFSKEDFDSLQQELVRLNKNITSSLFQSTTVVQLAEAAANALGRARDNSTLGNDPNILRALQNCRNALRTFADDCWEEENSSAKNGVLPRMAGTKGNKAPPMCMQILLDCIQAIMLHHNSHSSNGALLNNNINFVPVSLNSASDASGVQTSESSIIKHNTAEDDEEIRLLRAKVERLTRVVEFLKKKITLHEKGLNNKDADSLSEHEGKANNDIDGEELMVESITALENSAQQLFADANRFAISAKNAFVSNSHSQNIYSLNDEMFNYHQNFSAIPNAADVKRHQPSGARESISTLEDRRLAFISNLGQVKDGVWDIISRLTGFKSEALLLRSQVSKLESQLQLETELSTESIHNLEKSIKQSKEEAENTILHERLVSRLKSTDLHAKILSLERENTSLLDESEVMRRALLESETNSLQSAVLSKKERLNLSLRVERVLEASNSRERSWTNIISILSSIMYRSHVNQSPVLLSDKETNELLDFNMEGAIALAQLRHSCPEGITDILGGIRGMEVLDPSSNKELIPVPKWIKNLAPLSKILSGALRMPSFETAEKLGGVKNPPVDEMVSKIWSEFEQKVANTVSRISQLLHSSKEKSQHVEERIRTLTSENLSQFEKLKEAFTQVKQLEDKNKSLHKMVEAADESIHVANKSLQQTKVLAEKQTRNWQVKLAHAEAKNNIYFTQNLQISKNKISEDLSSNASQGQADLILENDSQVHKIQSRSDKKNSIDVAAENQVQIASHHHSSFSSQRMLEIGEDDDKKKNSRRRLAVEGNNTRTSAVDSVMESHMSDVTESLNETCNQLVSSSPKQLVLDKKSTVKDCMDEKEHFHNNSDYAEENDSISNGDCDPSRSISFSPTIKVNRSIHNQQHNHHLFNSSLGNNSNSEQIDSLSCLTSEQTREKIELNLNQTLNSDSSTAKLLKEATRNTIQNSHNGANKKMSKINNQLKDIDIDASLSSSHPMSLPSSSNSSMAFVSPYLQNSTTNSSKAHKKPLKLPNDLTDAFEPATVEMPKKVKGKTNMTQQNSSLVRRSVHAISSKLEDTDLIERSKDRKTTYDSSNKYSMNGKVNLMTKEGRKRKQMMSSSRDSSPYTSSSSSYESISSDESTSSYSSTISSSDSDSCSDEFYVGRNEKVSSRVHRNIHLKNDHHVSGSNSKVHPKEKENKSASYVSSKKKFLKDNHSLTSSEHQVAVAKSPMITCRRIETAIRKQDTNGKITNIAEISNQSSLISSKCSADTSQLFYERKNKNSNVESAFSRRLTGESLFEPSRMNSARALSAQDDDAESSDSCFHSSLPSSNLYTMSDGEAKKSDENYDMHVDRSSKVDSSLMERSQSAHSLHSQFAFSEFNKSVTESSSSQKHNLATTSTSTLPRLLSQKQFELITGDDSSSLRSLSPHREVTRFQSKKSVSGMMASVMDGQQNLIKSSTGAMLTPTELLTLDAELATHHDRFQNSYQYYDSSKSASSPVSNSTQPKIDSLKAARVALRSAANRCLLVGSQSSSSTVSNDNCIDKSSLNKEVKEIQSSVHSLLPSSPLLNNGSGRRMGSQLRLKADVGGLDSSIGLDDENGLLLNVQLQEFLMKNAFVKDDSGSI